MLFKKHRLLGSILSIFVVNGVYSTISSIGSYILTYFSVMSEIVFLVLMGFVTVLTVVGIIAMYLGMRYILQKKLNLD
jgi:fluoride ion exporter CrcB/FEX